MFYVYLLESLIDKSWYIGYTLVNPFRRLSKHNAKEVYYTKRKAPWKIIEKRFRKKILEKAT